MATVLPFVGVGKARHIKTPRPTIRQRRRWGAGMFALPFDQASPSTAARMRPEYPGAVGAYPMDTMARTVNARSRAISELNAGRITAADARLIFARTLQRAAQMAGRPGWHHLQPRVIERTRQGWRSKPVEASRHRARRGAANNWHQGLVSYGAGSSFPAVYDPDRRWNGFLAQPLFEEIVVRQIIAELNRSNPAEYHLHILDDRILEAPDGDVVGGRQSGGLWDLGAYSWTWVEDEAQPSGRANCGCGGPCCGGGKKTSGRANCGCRGGKKNVATTHITDIGPICPKCKGNDGLWGYGLLPGDRAQATCATCHHVEVFPSPEGSFVTAQALREAHNKTRGRAPEQGSANLYYDMESWYGRANASTSLFQIVLLGRGGKILRTAPADDHREAIAWAAAAVMAPRVKRAEVYEGGDLHTALNPKTAKSILRSLTERRFR